MTTLPGGGAGSERGRILKGGDDVKERSLDAMKRATVFLLNDYLERTRYKRQSFVSTRELWGQKNGVRDDTTAMIAALSKRIKKAENLLSELQS
jgi:hypothetical protein